MLLLPFVIAAWVGVGIAAVRGRSARELRLPTWAGWAIAGSLTVFWVLRNLSPPVFAWMAP